MANTFYWHDYETFGVDPAKDRPSQFAGLRTDEELNPIGDPLVIYCQPQRDILPSAPSLPYYWYYPSVGDGERDSRAGVYSRYT